VHEVACVDRWLIGDYLLGWVLEVLDRENWRNPGSRCDHKANEKAERKLKKSRAFLIGSRRHDHKKSPGRRGSISFARFLLDRGFHGELSPLTQFFRSQFL
jgi:hypothetical protein